MTWALTLAAYGEASHAVAVSDDGQQGGRSGEEASERVSRRREMLPAGASWASKAARSAAGSEPRGRGITSWPQVLLEDRLGDQPGQADPLAGLELERATAGP